MLVHVDICGVFVCGVGYVCVVCMYICAWYLFMYVGSCRYMCVYRHAGVCVWWDMCVYMCGVCVFWDVYVGVCWCMCVACVCWCVWWGMGAWVCVCFYNVIVILTSEMSPAEEEMDKTVIPLFLVNSSFKLLIGGTEKVKGLW